MSQFELEEWTTCRVSAVSLGGKAEGSEHVPTVDLTLIAKLPNDALSTIHGALKSMLYERSDPKQLDLAGVEPVSDMPALRCGILGPIPITKEWAGYTLEIQGSGVEKNIEVEKVDIGKMIITPHDGGTVQLKFHAQFTERSERTIGRIASFIGSEVGLSLTPPKS